MADVHEVQDALLDKITELTKQVGTGYDGSNASTVRNLAEAYAWLVAPDQPHGSSVRVGK